MVLIVQLILITPRELLVISSTVLGGKIQEVFIVTVASIKTSFYSKTSRSVENVGIGHCKCPFWAPRLAT